MASVIAIGSACTGECVEGICVEVGGRSIDSFLACLEFLVDCLGALLDQYSDCFGGEGARHWKPIDWLLGFWV